MDYNTPITAELVRQLLDYEPETGLLTWRKRPSDMFKEGDGRYTAQRNAASWNSRYAGKIAGGPDANGYTLISLFKDRFLAHRIAWLHYHGAWPINHIDHINGVRTDNRISNLRLATNSQNVMNCGKRINNSTGLKGAYFIKKTGRYISMICVNYKQVYLGVFATKEEAHAAYCEAATRLHGPFANTD